MLLDPSDQFPLSLQGEFHQCDQLIQLVPDLFSALVRLEIQCFIEKHETAVLGQIAQDGDKLFDLSLLRLLFFLFRILFLFFLRRLIEIEIPYLDQRLLREGGISVYRIR